MMDSSWVFWCMNKKWQVCGVKTRRASEMGFTQNNGGGRAKVVVVYGVGSVMINSVSWPLQNRQPTVAKGGEMPRKGGNRISKSRANLELRHG